MKLNQENGDRKKSNLFELQLVNLFNKTVTIKQEKNSTKYKIICMDLF